MAENFTKIVVATGVRPRKINIPGIDSPKVVGYTDVLTKKVIPGERVAIIGAGGIGFDIAAFLTHKHTDMLLDCDSYYDFWGIDKDFEYRAGLKNILIEKFFLQEKYIFCKENLES